MTYEIGDQVACTVIRATPLGYLISIDSQTEGLLYKNEVYQKLEAGDEINCFVKHIREDEKIDLSTRPQGFRNAIDSDCDQILTYLKKEGKLFLTDKSSPKDIYNTFNMSKKAFKKALGFLYKRKVILLLDSHIELTVKSSK